MTKLSLAYYYRWKAKHGKELSEMQRLRALRMERDAIPAVADEIPAVSGREEVERERDQLADVVKGARTRAAFVLTSARCSSDRPPGNTEHHHPIAESMGLPFGLTIIGRADSEANLIGFAYAVEQATQARKALQYKPTLVPW
jgi:Asp-tRNA(Asn)/Glu-tRNA(Gln) amidotransferase A subunit family amidase